MKRTIGYFLFCSPLMACLAYTAWTTPQATALSVIICVMMFSGLYLISQDAEERRQKG